MGVVLRAYDTRLNRLVALKMLPSNSTHDSELRHRLAAEARSASALSHPGIATVYDFVEQGDPRFAPRHALQLSWPSARIGSYLILNHRSLLSFVVRRFVPAPNGHTTRDVTENI